MYVLTIVFAGIIWAVLSIYYEVNGDRYMSLERSILATPCIILLNLNEMDS